MANCQSCNAPVIWALMLKQDGLFSEKPHPFNAEPQPGGEANLKGVYALVKRREGSPIAVLGSNLDLLMAMSPDEAGMALYTSHFSNCPNAESHRT